MWFPQSWQTELENLEVRVTFNQGLTHLAATRPKTCPAHGKNKAGSSVVRWLARSPHSEQAPDSEAVTPTNRQMLLHFNCLYLQFKTNFWINDSLAACSPLLWRIKSVETMWFFFFGCITFRCEKRGTGSLQAKLRGFHKETKKMDWTRQ